MSEPKILKSLKNILEYLETKYEFKLNAIRFNKLVKFHGFPVTQVGRNYIAREDCVDKWVDDLFNNRILSDVKSKYDLDKNPTKTTNKYKDKVKYIYPKKRGRKTTWKEEIKPKDWEFFLKKINGVLPWYSKKHEEMIHSAAKKLLLNGCAVTLIVNIIEQCMWSAYHEAVMAYEKEGTPYLNFRERKKFGAWQKKVRGKMKVK